MLLVKFVLYLAAAFYGVLGLILIRYPAPRWAKLPFVGLCTGLGLWLLYAGMAASNHTLHFVSPQLATLCVVSLFLLGGCMLWLPSTLSTRARHWVIINGMLSLVGVVELIYLVGWSVAVMPIPSSLWTLLQDATPFRWFGLWVLGCWVLGAVRLLYLIRQTNDIPRLHAQYLLVGVTQVVAITLVIPVPSEGTPFLRIPVVLFLFANMLLSANAAAMLTRYPIPSPRRVLRSGLLYVLTAGILLLIFAVCLPFIAQYVYWTYQRPHSLATVLITAGMMLGYPAILRVTDYVIGLLLFRSKRQSPLDLSRVTEKLTRTMERASLVTLVSETLEQLFMPTSASLYLKTGDTLQRIPSPEPTASQPATLSPDDPFVLSLKLGTIVRRPYADIAPWGDVHHRLQQYDAALAVPFILDDVVVGLALVGPKCSGSVYTDEDVACCELLRHPVAIALANIESHAHLREMIASLDAHVQQQTRELREANARLQEADQAKDQFLALVSHELLSPLTSILGWSDMSLMAQNPEKMAAALEAIHRSGLRQMRLVDDLLDVSRIIHGKLILSLAPMELWGAALQAVEEIRLRAEAKHLSLVLTPPDAPLPMVGDTARLTQVFINLLTNAIKFTPEGGTISVTGRQTGRMAVIEILDTGKGIPTEDLPVIFTLFKQATRGGSYGGLGIGLAIVQGIVDLHHGQVSAWSAGNDCGSTFTVEIPVACEMPDAGRLTPPDAMADTGRLLETEEALPASPVSTVTAEAYQATASAIASLSGNMVMQLREATLRGDMYCFHALVEQITREQPALAKMLRQLADAYDYDRLLSLFTAGSPFNDAAGHPGNHHGH